MLSCRHLTWFNAQISIPLYMEFRVLIELCQGTIQTPDILNTVMIEQWREKQNRLFNFSVALNGHCTTEILCSTNFLSSYCFWLPLLLALFNLHSIVTTAFCLLYNNKLYVLLTSRISMVRLQISQLINVVNWKTDLCVLPRVF